MEILIDSAGKVHIIGSPVQDEYEKEFIPFFRENDIIYDSLYSFSLGNYRKYGQDIPQELRNKANLLKEKFGSERTELLTKYIKLHPNSYIALWDIYDYVSNPLSHKYFDFEKMFSSFSSEMQQQSFINVLKEKLQASRKMQVGQTLPKDFFKGYEQMQNKIRKNNQYYLLDFWFSHCAPCIAGFPKLKEIYNKFHNKGFDVVSISIDEEEYEKEYNVAIQKNNLVWNHIWDKAGKTSKKFNINAYPTYILLDKNDKIINNNINAEQLEGFLEKNL
ncbi:MAG: TlpA disulfide reductase family protein [Niabella sp.]